MYVHMQGYVNACTSIFLVWHIELLFRRRPNFHFPDAVVLPTSARLKPGGCSNSGLKADRHRAGSLDRVSILRLYVGNSVPYCQPLVRSLASRISRNDFRPTAVQSALHARDNSEHLGTHRTCIRSTPCILCCLQKSVLFQRASLAPSHHTIIKSHISLSLDLQHCNIFCITQLYGYKYQPATWKWSGHHVER